MRSISGHHEVRDQGTALYRYVSVVFFASAPFPAAR